MAAEFSTTEVSGGSVAIWHLGQAGVAIKFPGRDGCLIIDPYLTFSIEERSPETEFHRGFAPPVAPSDVVNAAAVLVTHGHDDHLDLGTVTGVAAASERCVFVVPAPEVSLLAHNGIDSSRVIAARAGEPIDLGLGGVRVLAVAEAHTGYALDEHGDHRYLGYCITADDIRLFHAGDCIVDKHLIEEIERFKPDVVFLPINGADYARTARGIVGNMNYREAADFAAAVGADLVIPIHYDLFANNQENPSYFVDYLFHTYPAQRFHMFVPGERFIYLK